MTDSTRIPAEAKVSMQEINETGIEVRWWVAHEVQPNIKEDSPGVDAAAKVVVGLGGLAVAAAALPVIAIGVVTGAVVMGCLSGDPALIAEVKDKKGETKWVNCYRWYDV